MKLSCQFVFLHWICWWYTATGWSKPLVQQSVLDEYVMLLPTEKYYLPAVMAHSMTFSFYYLDLQLTGTTCIYNSVNIDLPLGIQHNHTCWWHTATGWSKPLVHRSGLDEYVLLLPTETCVS